MNGYQLIGHIENCHNKKGRIKLYNAGIRHNKFSTLDKAYLARYAPDLCVRRAVVCGCEVSLDVLVGDEKEGGVVIE